MVPTPPLPPPGAWLRRKRAARQPPPLPVDVKEKQKPSTKVIQATNAAAAEVRNKTADSYSIMQQHWNFFQEADTSGDNELTVDEFYAALPRFVKEKHSAQEISTWFAMIDVNGNGKVSMAEYLQWSLLAASRAVGTKLLHVFQKADKTGDGKISKGEFKHVADKLGVGDYAHEIFTELPQRADETVAYEDIVSITNGIKLTSRPALCSFISAMSWSSLDEPVRVDTEGWSFGCTLHGLESPAQARKELRELLAEKDVRLSDIFMSLDTSTDGFVTYDEFARGMQMMGFQGSQKVLQQIYALVDEDNSEEVDFAELNAWLQGRSLSKRGRLNTAKHLTLYDRVKAVRTPWDVDMLRSELRGLLEGASVTATDLLETWTAHSTLTKKTWLKELKKLCGVGHSLLWYDNVRDAVVDAFDVMDKDKGGSISVQELADFVMKAPRPHSTSLVEHKRGDPNTAASSTRSTEGTRSPSPKGGPLFHASDGKMPPWRPSGAAAKCAAKTVQSLLAANASHTTHRREDAICTQHATLVRSPQPATLRLPPAAETPTPIASTPLSPAQRAHWRPPGARPISPIPYRDAPPRTPRPLCRRPVFSCHSGEREPISY